jgi:micrococcal nuclease
MHRRSWSRALLWLALALTAAALSGCLPDAGPDTARPATSEPSTAGPGSREAGAVGDPAGGRSDSSGAMVRPEGVPDGAQPAAVARHVDGDTVWVEPLPYDQPVHLPLPDDAASRVRILLIDTPETVHPTRAVECGGPEASAATAKLIPVGTTVWILADVSDRDRYDRPLRYLWDEDGTSVGEQLLAAGLARVAHYPPDERYLDLYRRLESDAAAAGAGVWGQLCPAS